LTSTQPASRSRPDRTIARRNYSVREPRCNPQCTGTVLLTGHKPLRPKPDGERLLHVLEHSATSEEFLATDRQGTDSKRWIDSRYGGLQGPLLSLPRFSFSSHDAFNVRQEHSQQSQQGHEGTHAIYKTDAGVIRKFTQERRCNARSAECEAEEQP